MASAVFSCVLVQICTADLKQTPAPVHLLITHKYAAGKGDSRNKMPTLPKIKPKPFLKP
jgi:hypothetical protein